MFIDDADGVFILQETKAGLCISLSLREILYFNSDMSGLHTGIYY
jgi:hypothetical protein